MAVVSFAWDLRSNGEFYVWALNSGEHEVGRHRLSQVLLTVFLDESAILEWTPIISVSRILCHVLLQSFVGIVTTLI